MSEVRGFGLLRNYRLVVEGIRQSTEVVLLKGCARIDHPDPDEPVIAFDEYRFYQEPLPLGQDVAATLTELCCDSRQFYLKGDLSIPCAFHEDYALEWKQGDDATQMLFCFSCGLVYSRRAAIQEYFIMTSRKTFQNLFPPTRWELDEA
jgi:hypothetical protein